MSRLYALAADLHPAVVDPLGTEDGSHRLGAPRAEQSGQPEHLTRSHRKRHVPRLMPAAQPVRFGDDLVAHLLCPRETGSPRGRTSATSRPSIVAITSSLVVSVTSLLWARRPSRRIVMRCGDLEHLIEVVADKEQRGPGCCRRRIIPKTCSTSRARATRSARRGSPHAHQSTPLARSRSSAARRRRTIYSAPNVECRSHIDAGARGVPVHLLDGEEAPARSSLRAQVEISATDINGTRLVSWNVVLMPMSHACRVEPTSQRSRLGR